MLVRRIHPAWWMLSVTFLALFMLGGARHSFAVLYKSIERDLGVSRGGLAGAATLGGITAGIGFIIAGIAVDRYGPRRVIPVFSSLHLVGYLLMSQSTSLWHMYVGYGLMGGLAFGIGVGPFLAIIARWFDKHRGLALGLASSAAHMGVIVFSPAISVFEGAYGWRLATIWLAILPFAALIFAAAVVPRDPAEIGLLPNGAVASASSDGSGSTSLRDQARRVNKSNMVLSNRNLWILCIAYLGANLSTGVLLYHLVNFGTDQGLSPIFAAGLLSTLSGVSIVGRLGVGVLSNRYGAVALLALCFGMFAVSTAAFPFFPTVHGLYVLASMYGLFLGGTVVLMPIISREYFGEESLGTVLGAFLFSVNAGSSLGAWLGGYIFDHSASYAWAFYSSGAIAAVSALATKMYISPTVLNAKSLRR